MRSLEQITAEAIAIYNQTETDYRRWGKLMNEAKKLVKRGYWLNYLSKHFPEISTRQAERYMELARDKKQTKTMAKINNKPVRHSSAINDVNVELGQNKAEEPKPTPKGKKRKPIEELVEDRRKRIHKMIDTLDKDGLFWVRAFIRRYSHHVKYIDPGQAPEAVTIEFHSPDSIGPTDPRYVLNEANGKDKEATH